MNKSISLFSLTAILLVFSGLLIVVIKAAPSETGESASSKPLAVQATKSTPGEQQA